MSYTLIAKILIIGAQKFIIEIWIIRDCFLHLYTISLVLVWWHKVLAQWTVHRGRTLFVAS